MYKALDVARYVINYANEKGMVISNLKLQKILYFIQLQFLLDKKEICFSDEIQAWDFGPVVPDVYHEFKKYGSFGIPKVEYVYDFSDGWFNIKKIPYKSLIKDDDKTIIDDVVNACNNYSPGQLVEITHNQMPWKRAISCGNNSVITVELMKSFLNSI